ncbi:MAG TPA: hypothetical protein VF095_06355 [Bacillota bacterium]
MNTTLCSLVCLERNVRIRQYSRGERRAEEVQLQGIEINCQKLIIIDASIRTPFR